MTLFPIADLHCDLLFYLCLKSSRTPYDASLACSLPHFKAGQVKLQILPAYAEKAPNSALIGKRQVDCFFQLLSQYPEEFIRHDIEVTSGKSSVAILLAFENANAFCAEEDSLEESLDYLEKTEEKGAKITYISLTWNEENRFGGGCKSSTGLKKDGFKLLEFLNRRRIAIDLSHASDALAWDIFKAIDQQQWQIPVMASHSNFRRCCDHPRNLPDEIAREIFCRGGVIGINLVKSFIGETNGSLIAHLEHALKLGGGRQISFGADFFYPEDFPTLVSNRQDRQWFFSSWQNASCYPQILSFWRETLLLDEKQLSDISYHNIHNFLKEQIL